MQKLSICFKKQTVAAWRMYYLNLGPHFLSLTTPYANAVRILDKVSFLQLRGFLQENDFSQVQNSNPEKFY